MDKVHLMELWELSSCFFKVSSRVELSILNQKILFVVGILLRFTRTYPVEPGLPSAIKYSKPRLIRIRFDP